MTGTPAPRGSRAPGEANGPARDTAPGPARTDAAEARTEAPEPLRLPEQAMRIARTIAGQDAPRPDVPDDIVRYVAARDQERAERVDRALAALTGRERALVREAAVMGYVQGAMYASGGAPTPDIPPDAAIVARVVAACQSMDDLYPNLGSRA